MKMIPKLHIREADSSDVSLLGVLVRECFQDVAERFNLTLENCPKHPSHCTDDKDLKRWYLRIGFVEGETTSNQKGGKYEL